MNTLILLAVQNSDNFFKSHKSTIKLIIFSILMAVFFGAITYKIILIPNGPVQEYDAHILAAVQMYQEGRIISPHFLFHLLTVILHSTLGFLNLPTDEITGVNQVITYDWGFSALIVMIVVYVGIVLILFYHFKNIFKNNDNLAYLVAFGLSISTPIFLLAPIDNLYFLGYVSPSTIYIIPTQVISKLTVLPLLLWSPRYFTQNSENVKRLIAVFLMVILCGLAKPNGLLAMLPSLGIISLINLIKGRYINWFFIGIILLASLIVLSWQYYFKFYDDSSPIYKSSIILTEPFEVWRYYSDYLFIKIILSILFPLYVAIFFWKTVKDDFLFSYGWLLFFIGLIFSGFFGESQPYTYAGNFCWTGLIACFMLFVATASVFFSKCMDVYPENKKKFIVGVVVFGSHIVCGLFFYFRSFDSLFI